MKSATWENRKTIEVFLATPLPSATLSLDRRALKLAFQRPRAVNPLFGAFLCSASFVWLGQSADVVLGVRMLRGSIMFRRWAALPGLLCVGVGMHHDFWLGRAVP